MARKRLHDDLRRLDRARAPITLPPATRGHPLDPDAWLAHYHAHLDPPDRQHPYWIVRTAAGVYLGAGSTPRRAVVNARTRLRNSPDPRTPS